MQLIFLLVLALKATKATILKKKISNDTTVKVTFCEINLYVMLIFSILIGYCLALKW